MSEEKENFQTVNVCGHMTEVIVQEGWQTVAPVTTKARWQTGYGEQPFDTFEVRDDTGRLLLNDAELGPWFDGVVLYVNRLPGVGA